MQPIIRELKKNLDAEEVHLEGRGIRHLGSLLPVLATMPRLRCLYLGNNSLTSLPSDMSSLQKLEVLDLSGNPITSVADVVHGLLSLVSLRDLTVHLPVEAEERDLVAAVPLLERFNGVDLSGARPQEALAEPEVSGRYWTDAEREGIESLFGAVRVGNGKKGTAQFQEYLSRIETHVKALTAASTSHAEQEGETLKARRMLYEYCCDVCEHTFKEADDKARVHAVCRYGVDLLDDYDRHWRAMHSFQERRLEAMRSDLEAAVAQIDALMRQQHQGGGSTESPSRGAQLGGRAFYGGSGSSSRDRHRDPSGGAPRGGPAGRGGASAARTPKRPTTATGSSVTPAGTGGGGGRSRGANPSPPSSSSSPTPAATKVLTLKQVKDAIEDIYSSKVKYDARCKENGLPRETMEQHMYTFLNQRYGLREIIVEWVTALFAGIQRYATLDNDVAVFGKILRNEIDEEFRFVQQQVRETVRELLRAFIKRKAGGGALSDREAEEVARERMSGTLRADEWQYIVGYMYNDSDCRTVTALIRDLYAASGGNRDSDEEILYADFTRVLLDFQLDRHERFLAPFVKIFRQHDLDRNGIVNRDEFLAIIAAVGGDTMTESTALAMCEYADPAGACLYTFSDGVSVLGERLMQLSSAAED